MSTFQDQINIKEKELKDAKKLLGSLSKATKKEYDEYARITRSKSQKLLAHLRPNGQQTLAQQTRKEETEYLEAQRMEGRQRDLVAAIEEEIEKLEKQLKETAGEDSASNTEAKTHIPSPSGSTSVPAGTIAASRPGPDSIEPFHLPPHPTSPLTSGLPATPHTPTQGPALNRTSASLRTPQHLNTQEPNKLRKTNSLRPSFSPTAIGSAGPSNVNVSLSGATSGPRMDAPVITSGSVHNAPLRQDSTAASAHNATSSFATSITGGPNGLNVIGTSTSESSQPFVSTRAGPPPVPPKSSEMTDTSTGEANHNTNHAYDNQHQQELVEEMEALGLINPPEANVNETGIGRRFSARGRQSTGTNINLGMNVNHGRLDGLEEVEDGEGVNTLPPPPIPLRPDFNAQTSGLSSPPSSSYVPTAPPPSYTRLGTSSSISIPPAPNSDSHSPSPVHHSPITPIHAPESTSFDFSNPHAFAPSPSPHFSPPSISPPSTPYASPPIDYGFSMPTPTINLPNPHAHSPDPFNGGGGGFNMNGSNFSMPMPSIPGMGMGMPGMSPSQPPGGYGLGGGYGGGYGYGGVGEIGYGGIGYRPKSPPRPQEREEHPMMAGFKYSSDNSNPHDSSLHRRPSSTSPSVPNGHHSHSHASSHAHAHTHTHTQSLHHSHSNTHLHNRSPSLHVSSSTFNSPHLQAPQQDALLRSRSLQASTSQSTHLLSPPLSVTNTHQRSRSLNARHSSAEHSQSDSIVSRSQSSTPAPSIGGGDHIHRNGDPSPPGAFR